MEWKEGKIMPTNVDDFSFETENNIIRYGITTLNQWFRVSPVKTYQCPKHGTVREVVIFHYDVDKIEKGRHYCIGCLEDALRKAGLIPLIQNREKK